MLILEDFEKLDLKAPPAGFTISSFADLSIIDEAGKGKILKITGKGKDL